MAPIRKPYPSDVSDEEWSLVAPYLALINETAPQRQHSLRELFNGLRYVIRYGIAWRAMPNDLPPWFAVYQQTQRWLAAGVFDALAQDLRALLRLASGRKEEPTAAIIDSRTLRSTPESGPRAGYDGAKRKRGSKLHMAVDTLGHLLALHVTPANVDDRAEVGKLADAIQEATGESVELIYVDQGYTVSAVPLPCWFEARQLAIFCYKALHTFGAKLCKRLVGVGLGDQVVGAGGEDLKAQGISSSMRDCG